MTTFEECKQETAVKYGFSTWQEFEDSEVEHDPDIKSQLWDEAVQLYTKELHGERDSAVNNYLDQRGLNQSLAKTITELQAEVERLKGVNKQHIQVWKDVDEFVRNHKDTKLGDSVSGKALEMLKRVDQLESERDKFAIGFSEWVERLKPHQRVSVWSKSGEYTGLFDMDNEQLLAKYKQSLENQTPKL